MVSEQCGNNWKCLLFLSKCYKSLKAVWVWKWKRIKCFKQESIWVNCLMVWLTIWNFTWNISWSSFAFSANRLTFKKFSFPPSSPANSTLTPEMATLNQMWLSQEQKCQCLSPKVTKAVLPVMPKCDSLIAAPGSPVPLSVTPGVRTAWGFLVLCW